MEILFFISLILLVITIIYFIGRMVHNNHNDLILAYKKSDFLFEMHVVLGIMMTFLFFITLCAFNNTFWHLPYIFK